jgi:hypothetical protein
LIQWVIARLAGDGDIETRTHATDRLKNPVTITELAKVARTRTRCLVARSALSVGLFTALPQPFARKALPLGSQCPELSTPSTRSREGDDETTALVFRLARENPRWNTDGSKVSS